MNPMPLQCWVAFAAGFIVGALLVALLLDPGVESDPRPEDDR